LREEKDKFMRSQENNSVSSGAYWDEYSDASESSIERYRDPKHIKRTTAWVREERHVKSISAHPSDNEEDFVQETPEAALVAGSSTGVPTNYATKAWRSAGAHASSRNTKPRVGRRQAKETSSREKGDIS
jgi:hypothetical protein